MCSDVSRLVAVVPAEWKRGMGLGLWVKEGEFEGGGRRKGYKVNLIQTFSLE